MSDKTTIYAGNGKQINSQYGTFRSISICLTDLPKEYITKAKNGKSYINLNVNDKDQKDQYGNDVVVTVNQFKPQKQPQQSQQPKQKRDKENIDLDNLHFIILILLAPFLNFVI